MICAALIVIMLLGTAVPVNGASNRIMTGFSKYYGNCFKTVNSGVNKYHLYKNLKTGTIIYTGSFLTDLMWHTKGRAGKTVKGSSGKSYSFSSTVSWNRTIGGSVGIDKLVNVAAEKGYGTSFGWSVSKSVARECSLEEKGIKNAKSGYYTLAAGQPNYKIHWSKKNRFTDKQKGQGAFYMPYGGEAVFIVRSLNNQTTWVLYDRV